MTKTKEKRKPAGTTRTAKASARGKSKELRAEKTPKRVSALDAAVQILAKSDKPMRAPELIAAMAASGLWKSPGGKTPHATLYAAMIREERDKKNASRFKKVDRGMFTFSGKAA